MPIYSDWAQLLKQDGEILAMSLLFSAWTVLVAIVFLGIVIWVLREKKETFDEAANIPFEEDDTPSLEGNKEDNHG